METGQKTAFVFAGGGSLGAIQVGMLRVLLAAGLQPDFVIGSSVGAVNAAYFAGAPNAEGVEKLADLWSGLRRSDVFPFTFASAVGLLRHPDYSSTLAACGV
jgi:NTE family protein